MVRPRILAQVPGHADFLLGLCSALAVDSLLRQVNEAVS